MQGSSLQQRLMACCLQHVSLMHTPVRHSSRCRFRHGSDCTSTGRSGGQPPAHSREAGQHGTSAKPARRGRQQGWAHALTIQPAVTSRHHLSTCSGAAAVQTLALPQSVTWAALHRLHPPCPSSPAQPSPPAAAPPACVAHMHPTAPHCCSCSPVVQSVCMQESLSTSCRCASKSATSPSAHSPTTPSRQLTQVWLALHSLLQLLGGLQSAPAAGRALMKTAIHNSVKACLAIDLVVLRYPMQFLAISVHTSGPFTHGSLTLTKFLEFLACRHPTPDSLHAHGTHSGNCLSTLCRSCH